GTSSPSACMSSNTSATSASRPSMAALRVSASHENDGNSRQVATYTPSAVTARPVVLPLRRAQMGRAGPAAPALYDALNGAARSHPLLNGALSRIVGALLRLGVHDT